VFGKPEGAGRVHPLTEDSPTHEVEPAPAPVAVQPEDADEAIAPSVRPEQEVTIE